MTAGRVLVLGDPGPWICAGMTGGILYLRLQPSLGFDETALRRRIARGADIAVQPVSPQMRTIWKDLLTPYAHELEQNHQSQEAYVLALLDNWQTQFIRIVLQPSGEGQFYRRGLPPGSGCSVRAAEHAYFGNICF